MNVTPGHAAGAALDELDVVLGFSYPGASRFR